MSSLRCFLWGLIIWVGIFPPTAQARPLFYIEEFYKLYFWPLYTNKFDARRNLFWLEVALKAPFAPPVQSLVICKTPQEYEKYKVLLKMHLNHLMSRSCLTLAAQFDVPKPRWYQKPYKKEILQSLQLAQYYYTCVERYWQQVQALSQESVRISSVQLDMEHWEQVAFQVRKGKLDLQKLAAKKIEKIQQKIQFYQNL